VTTYISDPLRDASDVFAGFLYQIDRTVQRWLDIRDDELLDLERGEDLDVIQFSVEDVPETRTLEQIKRRSTTSVSMKSTDALAAIAHFCEHRKKNPSSRLRFRFITTATLAKEQAWKHPGTAISTWQTIQREQLNDEEQKDALRWIREFLSICSAPDSVKQEIWALVEDLTKEENSGALLEVVQSFEWGFGSADYLEIESGIKQALLQTGLAENEEIAEALFERLSLFVFKRLSEPGIKRLTSTELREQLRQPTFTGRDLAFLQFTRDLREAARRIEQLPVAKSECINRRYTRDSLDYREGSMAVRILIADDDPTIRILLRRLLERHSDWRVCGEAVNGVDAVEKVEVFTPDLAI
jgi:hypothetical protein